MHLLNTTVSTSTTNHKQNRKEEPYSKSSLFTNKKVTFQLEGGRLMSSLNLAHRNITDQFPISTFKQDSAKKTSKQSTSLEISSARASLDVFE